MFIALFQMSILLVASNRNMNLYPKEIAFGAGFNKHLTLMLLGIPIATTVTLKQRSAYRNRLKDAQPQKSKNHAALCKNTGFKSEP